MSSRCPVSIARPHRFWSIEYGDRDVTSIGSPFSSANAMALSLVMPESRTGASTLTSGARAARPTSKRTWSLPLPVQPWATTLAPNSRATRARCETISGRDSADTSGYRSMYRALALSAGTQKSAANSSRTSTTTASAAPQASARPRIAPRSSPPWPTSTATAMTSAPVCSAIQPIATEVSRPPENASTTRCVMVYPSASVVVVVLGNVVLGNGGPSPRIRLTASFRELQERPRDICSPDWVPGYHQDGIVARHRAQDGRPGGVIDRRREELRPARRRADHDQVGAGLGGDEQFRRDPGQPRGSLPVRPGRQFRAHLPFRDAARP